jgi:putative hemolysin
VQTYVGEERFELKRLAREPLFISEDRYADEALTMFRQTGIHVAIVLDEYKQVSGLVTLEDLVKDLVGGVESEYKVSDEQ